MGYYLGEFEQLLLLALLRLGDGASGAAILREIESRTGRPVSAGAVYTGFERLRRKGLIAAELGEPTRRRGGKPQRLYRFEPSGVKALEHSFRAISRMADGTALQLGSTRR